MRQNKRMISSSMALLPVTRWAPCHTLSVLSVLPVGALLGRHHFPDEETKVQRGLVTWLRPYSSKESEAGGLNLCSAPPNTHLSDNSNNCHKLLCHAQALRSQCPLLLVF